MAVHPDLIDLVRCPRCHGRLELQSTSAAGEHFQCHGCRVMYPVIDGIPQLLVDEARPLEGAPEKR